MVRFEIETVNRAENLRFLSYGPKIRVKMKQWLHNAIGMRILLSHNGILKIELFVLKD